MYHILSSSLFLTLGCHDLAKHSLKYLFQDIKNTTKRDLNGSSYHYNKDVLIMNYVYEHKFDQQRIVVVKDLIAKTEETESNNSTLKKVTKHKRSLNKGDIDLYFFVKFRCGIVRPLGIMLNSISNLTCLQLCLNDESCKSAGYTNDNSQQCHLNTEIENEVGAFFSCGQGESRRWNYCEKRKDIKYFLISCKLYGGVLQASSDTTVQMLPYNEDDSQFWFWEIRVITKLPNSEQSNKGKVKTHKYINRQNQSTTGKL